MVDISIITYNKFIVISLFQFFYPQILGRNSTQINHITGLINIFHLDHVNLKKNL